MLFVALIGCVFMFAVANVAARTFGNIAASVAAFLSILPAILLMVFSPAMLINWVLLVTIGIAGAVRKTDAAVFGRRSIAAFAIAMATSSGVAVYGIVTPSELERRFPRESMETRLPYEQGLSATSAAVATSPEVHEHLQDLEQRISRSRPFLRNRALSQLHQSMVMEFINSSGFGVGRMTHLGEGFITKFSANTPISLPALDKFEYETPATTVATTMPAPDQLWKTHTENYLNFVYPEGFGYIKNRRQVVGFIEHGFGDRRFRNGHPDGPAAAKPVGHAAELDGNWRISQLELVSLLKFDAPRVYVSKHLPQMKELKNASTRALSEFEADGLIDLQNGEDFAVASEPHRTRVLGSLRAVKQCLECHNVERGQLLGAFSYEFSQITSSETD